MQKIQEWIEEVFASNPDTYSAGDRQQFADFKMALNAGYIRAAEPDPASPTGWRVNPWVKMGILVGFRMGGIVDMSVDREHQPFFDKDTYPVKQFPAYTGVRIVPGGTSIRDGCYQGSGAVFMPPSYANVGSYIGNGTMIDSHALVGSCAQIGSKCHISAAAQIGGVLEPIGALPVIIEDEVMVGGNCGVYEGVVVKRRAVLGSGVILNASTRIYDIVKNEVYRSTPDSPLVVPVGAVVVAGSRSIGEFHKWEERCQLQVYAPIIVKYRDEKTDAKTALEEALR